MYLRPLKLEDAPLMLEWMHDDSVVHDLQTDFSTKSIDDCITFIEKSLNDKENLNLAISDDNDEYMGTVSLKHITKEFAEFAIVIRKCAMGSGFSWYGMKNILYKALNEYCIDTVYWCVSKNNTRAIKFYDKHGFSESVNVPERIFERYDTAFTLKWYFVDKNFNFGIKENP